eukprot:391331_1
MAKSNSFLQLANICKSFQKYIGNEDVITCNIKSKEWSTFHIHPQLFANNFFERRKQFCAQLKRVINSIPTKDELLEYLKDEEISFMLHHFGIQKVIKNMKQYEQKISKAKQTFHKLNIDDYNFNDNDFASDNDSTFEKHFNSKLFKKNFQQFLFKYCIDLHYFETCKGQRNETKYFHIVNLISLGSIIHILPSAIQEIIETNTLSELYKKLKIQKQKQQAPVDRKVMIKICQQIQSWGKYGQNISEIGTKYKENGIQMMRDNYFNYSNCDVCHSANHLKNKMHFGVELLLHHFIVLGMHLLKCYKTLAVVRICVLNDLKLRIEEMLRLHGFCFGVEEYFIAAKLLRYAYKLSYGFIEIGGWDDDKYQENLDKLNDIWWNLKCENCGLIAVDSIKHKICTGCMKIGYCSRFCQKIHWNQVHRYECSKTWISLYNALRITMFDRFL